MNDYLTEQEQIQLLKEWIKRYGPTILTGIIIAFVITISWRYYQGYKYKTLSQASSAYDAMLASRIQNNQKESIVQANKIVKNFPSTPYAHMSALLIARDAVINQNFDEANKQLEWVIHKGNDKSIRQIARLRKARVLIAQNKAQDAIKLLDTVNDITFAGMIAEIKGDAYLSLNDKASARKFYQQGLKELPNAEVTRPLLQMKYDNLAL